MFWRLLVKRLPMCRPNLSPRRHVVERPCVDSLFSLCHSLLPKLLLVLYELNYFPPKSYCGVLTPSTCDLTWKQGLCNGTQVNKRSLGGPLSNMTGVLTKRRMLPCEDADAQGGRPVLKEAEIGVTFCMPRNVA